MKRLVVGLLLVSMAMMVIACRGKETDERAELTVWFGREPKIPADNFRSLKAMYPHIDVIAEPVPFEQSTASFIRNHAVGEEPDLVQVFHVHVPTLVAQGILHDMTPYVEDWKKSDPDSFNKVSPLAFAGTTIDGKIYGMAVTAGPIWFTYRTDWFAEAGLNPPETWDDVIESGKVLRDRFLKPGQYAYALPGSTDHDPHWFISKFIGVGGTYDEQGLPQIDSEAGRYLIQVYQTLAKEGLIAGDSLAWGPGEFRGAFISGNAAMAPIGDNVYPAVGRSLKFEEEFVVIRLPHRPGAEALHKTALNAWPLVVSSNTKHPAEAMLLLRYLVEYDTIFEIASTYTATTNMEVMYSEEYAKIKPFGMHLSSDFEIGKVIPGHVRMARVYEILSSVKQEALANPDVDPGEIARKWQRELNSL